MTDCMILVLLFIGPIALAFYLDSETYRRNERAYWYDVNFADKKDED